MAGEQPVGECIVNCPIPVHNDIPESAHCPDLFQHVGADDRIVREMADNVLIFARDPERQIGIEDGTDIKDILETQTRSACIFRPGSGRVFKLLVR